MSPVDGFQVPLVAEATAKAAARASHADASWLLPLRLLWSGFSPKEIEARDFKRKLDAVVVPVFGLWYLAQAQFVCAPGAVPPDLPASALTTLLRWLLALVAVWVLAVHVWAFPSPTEVQDAFKVQRLLGRWIYLTRHCVTLQAWHLVFSAAASSWPSLRTLADGMAVWIGALGWFVTIQYFVLVTPSKPFQQDCDLWVARGVQFREVGVFVHAPALPLAVLDLLASKSSAGLGEAFSPPRTALMVVLYTVLYVSLIVCNFQATGLWPYGFLSELGTSIGKWSKFIAGQTAILLAFAGANALLLRGRLAFP